MIATSYRYIVQRSGVRSGHPIVEGTRIGVHDVVAMVKSGASVDDVVASFPRLTRAQVYECLAYYEDHQGELELLVATQTEHLDE
jgi:type III restriction enzyme